jgi:hypothetical protein
MAEGIQLFPFFGMIFKIGFVLRRSGKVQFLKPARDPSADLPAHFSKA